MSDTRSTVRAGSLPSAQLPVGGLGAASIDVDLDDPLRALRALGARAHQMRASVTAADRFIARDGTHDRNTGSWLISAAAAMATEMTADIDSLARGLRDRPADTVVLQTVSALRVRAHQLSAATRAADHFLDQETREDRDTGSWLVATALGLAQKLAEEIDNGASAARRPVGDKGGDKGLIEPHDAALARRLAATTTTSATPLRGAA
jgi:hypothetical protein